MSEFYSTITSVNVKKYVQKLNRNLSVYISKLLLSLETAITHSISYLEFKVAYHIFFNPICDFWKYYKNITAKDPLSPTAFSVPKRNKKLVCEEGGREEKVHLLTHATARGMGKNQDLKLIKMDQKYFFSTLKLHPVYFLSFIQKKGGFGGSEILLSWVSSSFWPFLSSKWLNF